MSSPALSLAPLALGLLAGAGSAACADAAAADEPLAVRDRAIDFGSVFEGRVLEHEWELAVRAPLSVSEARTDCGCTLAVLERAPRGAAEGAPYELGAPLAPGDRLRVRAKYDTRGRRGPSVRAVTLTPSTGAPLALTLAADVRPWLLAEPEELAYARVLEGEPAERAFRVRAAGGEPFALAATGRALPPWVSVTVAPDGPDDAGRAALWDVRVVLGTGVPRGHYSYPIELESDVPVPGTGADEAERRFTLAPSWTLQVVGPVALSAPTLDFGRVFPAETVARTVRLESFDPAFEPRDARARLEPLHAGDPLPLAETARVHVRPNGRTCDIELTLAGLAPGVSGQFLAKLVVETGHPALPELEALVRGVCIPDAVPAGAPSAEPPRTPR